MEKMRFAGGVERFVNNQAAIGEPAISDTSPTAGSGEPTPRPSR
jgi:hypothetical protein